MSDFDKTRSVPELANTVNLINVEVYENHVLAIPESAAAKIAYDVCAEYAANHSDKDIAEINITQPSDNKYETDSFHMFLILTSELEISKQEVEAALSYQHDGSSLALDIHTSIAEERVASDDLKTGLSNTYDVIKGRFKREVREYEYKQKVEEDACLIRMVQDGDESSLEDIFNRNGDVIIGDLLRHGHDAPNEIIDLAEEAVRQLVESASPDELASSGLDAAVRGAVQSLIFEMVPLYREEVENRQRQKSIKNAVGNLKASEYVAKLISFEEKEKREADEFIEPAPIKLHKQQAAVVVKAGVDYLRARADNEINPAIETLDKISNQDKRRKSYRQLRDKFRKVFRKHIDSSARMKQMGMEAFDILDVYELTDQGHTRQWSSFLNQIINTLTEAK